MTCRFRRLLGAHPWAIVCVPGCVCANALVEDVIVPPISSDAHRGKPQEANTQKSATAVLSIDRRLFLLAVDIIVVVCVVILYCLLKLCSVQRQRYLVWMPSELLVAFFSFWWSTEINDSVGLPRGQSTFKPINANPLNSEGYIAVIVSLMAGWRFIRTFCTTATYHRAQLAPKFTRMSRFSIL